MKILILSDYYYPGYRAGGPIKSLRALVEALVAKNRLALITRAWDAKEKKLYSSVTPGRWACVDGAAVLYLNRWQLNPLSILRILRLTDYDVIYLNSLFSPVFTLIPLILRRIKWIKQSGFVIAPRGECSAGALGIKGIKKRIFMRIARAVGIYEGLIWQASSSFERQDILGQLSNLVYRGNPTVVTLQPGFPLKVVTLPDLVGGQPAQGNLPRRKGKVPGVLDIVFYSRISSMKNLLGAAHYLRSLVGEVRFCIYGPIEDERYWIECRRVLDSLPKNIAVEYYGAVKPDDVTEVLGRHQVFLLPTLGENFGHVILEALQSGCPVIISNRTPWKDLRSANCGWTLDLDAPQDFSLVLQQCIDCGTEEFQNWSHNAVVYATRFRATSDNLEEKYINMFAQAIQTRC